MSQPPDEVKTQSPICLSFWLRFCPAIFFFFVLWKKNKDGKAAFSQAFCPWSRVMCWLTWLHKPSEHEKEWLREAAEEKLTCTGKFVLGAPVCHLCWNTQRSPEDSGGHSEGVHTGHWPSCFSSSYQHEIVGQQESSSSNSFTPPSLRLLLV